MQWRSGGVLPVADGQIAGQSLDLVEVVGKKGVHLGLLILVWEILLIINEWKM